MILVEAPESSPHRLVVSGVVPGASPPQLYGDFTIAERLERWWAQRASVDLVAGGELLLEWLDQGWTLRGRFRDLRPGERVGFSWSWDHEPTVPTREVIVTFGQGHAGTLMRIEHGEYTVGDADERQGHLEGWQHFASQLAALYG